MQKKLYRSQEKKICGICAGLADYFNLDPTIVRLIAVEIAFLTAAVPTLIAYFVMAFVIPEAPADVYQTNQNTARRLSKGTDKKISGVCSGIAEYLNMDPTIVRLIFVLLFLLIGNGLYTYIACMIIFPEAPQPYGQPQYGQPPYGQPQYDQTQYAQPQYEQQYAQQQYEQPVQEAQPQQAAPQETSSQEPEQPQEPLE